MVIMGASHLHILGETLCDPIDKGYRRSKYDVSNRIDVTRASCVSLEVCNLFKSCYPNYSCLRIEQAFMDFEAIYKGDNPSFHACETDYHNIQHVLDVTLATMRLIDGYEKVHRGAARLGPLRAIVGVITALFHDVGYIREIDDNLHQHGAEYTKVHVTRSGLFLRRYLSGFGMRQEAELVQRLVQYTGYEKPVDALRMEDPLYQQLGFIIGSADVIAQMADRIYLEKCRDYLFPEFEKGGLTKALDDQGEEQIIFHSEVELLEKTPEFIHWTVDKRLKASFQSAYRYAESHFDGPNLYMVALQKNVSYLESLIAVQAPLVLRREGHKNT